MAREVGPMGTGPAGLERAAAQLQAHADLYRSSYRQLCAEVEEMRAAWAGGDNAAFTAQILSFQADFQRMEQSLRDCAALLHRAAASGREDRTEEEEERRQRSR